MAQDKNIFGGGNPTSLYTPMSDVEQEVLSRLVEAGDLRIVIVGWGVVSAPRATFGDLRLQLQFRLHFDRPETPMPVHYFDLELRTGSDLLLFKERQSVTYNGNPLLVAAGVYLDLVWDIAIQAMSPEVVRSIKPSTIGLTSRWIDKETGALTLQGNTKLSSEQQKALGMLRRGEALSRKHTKVRAKKATGGN